MFNKKNSLFHKINNIIKLPNNITKFIIHNCFSIGFHRFQMFFFFSIFQNRHHPPLPQSKSRKCKGRLTTARSRGSTHGVTSYVLPNNTGALNVKEAHIQFFLCSFESISSAMKIVSLLFNKTSIIKHCRVLSISLP